MAIARRAATPPASLDRRPAADRRRCPPPARPRHPDARPNAPPPPASRRVYGDRPARGHHAALAVRHAAGIQDPVDMPSECREPSLGGRPLAGIRIEDQGIVLVGRQQAFAAAGGSEHQEAPRARRAAPAVADHHRLGQRRGSRGHVARHRGDDRGDRRWCNVLGQQRRRQRRQARVRRTQGRGIGRDVDFVTGTRAKAARWASSVHRHHADRATIRATTAYGSCAIAVAKAR